MSRQAIRAAALGGSRHDCYSVTLPFLSQQAIQLQVTCCCLQAVGIRFIGFRNEQAAGYAAAACGYLTGVPGVLLTVSGPGAVHGIAGLSHAGINCWPMIMLSGSSEQVPGSRLLLCMLYAALYCLLYCTVLHGVRCTAVYAVLKCTVCRSACCPVLHVVL